MPGSAGETPCVSIATVRIVRSLAGQERRSLASEYLHFHRPDAFLIYDSRACTTLRYLRTLVPASTRRLPVDADDANGRFVLEALACRDGLTERYHVHLTPRQFDRILLALHQRGQEK
jgi:hypothetical protein